MAENNNKKQQNQNPQKQSGFSFMWIFLILIIGCIILSLPGGFSKNANPTKVEWDEVQELILAGDVKEIEFVRNDLEGKITLRQESLSKYADKYFGGEIPRQSPHLNFLVSGSFNPEVMFGELNGQLEPEQRAKVVMTKNDHTGARVMEWILPLLLFIILWVFLMRGMNRNAGGANGGIFNAGKAPGRIADKKEIKVTFKDVAGLYGAKEEVMEIVDFLKNPKTYTSLGGKIPKGALLVGPPGTG